MHTPSTAPRSPAHVSPSLADMARVPPAVVLGYLSMVLLLTVVQEWIFGGVSYRESSPAVLLAAAEVRLTKKAKFPVDRFLARVAEIVAEEGPSK